MAKRGKKLDDGLKEKIKAHYTSCGNQRETARKYGISPTTVKRLVDDNKDNLEQLRTQKKKEHIEKAWGIINLYMEHVQKPEVVDKTSAQGAAVLMGTLWDKVNKEKELKIKEDELEQRKAEATPSELDKEEKRLKIEKLKAETEKIKNADVHTPINIMIAPLEDEDE